MDRALMLWHLRTRREAVRLDRRLHALETEDGLQKMLRAHVEYLDFLTVESGGTVNHRTAFTSWYLTHRPKGSLK